VRLPTRLHSFVSLSHDKMLFRSCIAITLAGIALAQEHISTAGLIQNNATGAPTRLRYDNGTYGPEMEEVHYCKYPYLPRRPFEADSAFRLRSMADWHLSSL